MAIYTVQVPPGALGEPALEEAVLLREGFSWPAFFFGLLWLIWHGLWATAAIWLAVSGLFAWLAIWNFGFWTSLLIALALRILLGLEANALLRHGFARRRYRLIDIVAGAAPQAAERRFFNRVLPAPPDAETAPKDAPAPPPSQDAEVLGVFPQPEQRR